MQASAEPNLFGLCRAQPTLCKAQLLPLARGNAPGIVCRGLYIWHFCACKNATRLKRVTLKRDTALLTYHLTVHFHQDIFYFLRGIFSFLPHIFHHLREKVCYKVCNIYYKVANMYYKVCNACYKLCNKNFLIG